MIKIAVIGAGFIGKVHAESYRKIKNARLVSVVEKNLEKGKKFADEFDVKFYSDIDELLNIEEVDIIDICTPPLTHYELVKKAAIAKKHIICEKPLTLSLKEADEMVSIVEEKNLKAMVGLVLRFWPEYVLAKKIIDKGKLGKPLYCYCERLSRMENENCSDNWRFDEKYGGGAAVDLHIHDLDFINWLFKKPATIMSKGIYDEKFGGFIHIISNITFKDGEIGLVEGSWGFRCSFPFTMGFRILCEKGTIEWSTRTGKNIEKRFKKSKFLVYKCDGTIIKPSLDSTDAFILELDYFVNCVEKDIPIERATFKDGKRAVELSLASIKSAKEDRIIKI